MSIRGRLWGATGRLRALLRPALLRDRPIGHIRLPFTDFAVLSLSLVCSAVLLGVAIESHNYPWVAWGGLTPLFLVIRSLTPLRAMSCGALWGLCLFVLLVSGNGAAALPLDDSFVLLILIPASYTFAGAHLTRRIGFSPLILAFGWVGVEFALRPLGLTRGLLAGSQGDTGIIRQVGMPLGYMFVVFLIAFVDAMLLSVFCNTRFRINGLSSLHYISESRRRIVPLLSLCVPIFAANVHQPRAPPN